MFFQFQAAAVQMNNSAYDSPAFEALLDKADQEADGAARAVILGQANAMLLKDLPASPMLFQYSRHLVKSYVLNWTDNPRNVNRTRWLDVGERTAAAPAAGADGGGQGIWGWLASWFSGEAWSKWWNS